MSVGAVWHAIYCAALSESTKAAVDAEVSIFEDVETSIRQTLATTV
jgi:hypothetical protein